MESNRDLPSLVGSKIFQKNKLDNWEREDTSVEGIRNFMPKGPESSIQERLVKTVQTNQSREGKEEIGHEMRPK